MTILKNARQAAWVLLLAAIALNWIMPASAEDISSYARVNEDGSLQISGKTIHLYGIHIPRTNRTCRTDHIPPICGSRAVVALNTKISGFVRCEIMAKNKDGSLVGWCRVKASKFNQGEDLSAYLLEQGWAVALPNAPFEYQTLEKIARHRSFGVWGMQVDRIIR